MEEEKKEVRPREEEKVEKEESEEEGLDLDTYLASKAGQNLPTAKGRAHEKLTDQKKREQNDVEKVRVVGFDS